MGTGGEGALGRGFGGDRADEPCGSPMAGRRNSPVPSLRRARNTRGSERRAQRVRGERRGQTSAGRAARECPVRRVPVLAAEGRALDVRGAAARRVRGTRAGNAAQWRSLEDRECARGLESSVLVTWGSRNAPPLPHGSGGSRARHRGPGFCVGSCLRSTPAVPGVSETTGTC